MANKNDKKQITKCQKSQEEERQEEERVESLRESIKKKPLVFVTFLLAVATFAMAIFTLLLALTNWKLVDYAHQSNKRAEKLFVGQSKPLIDVTPISISLGESEKKEKMVTTRFSVVNYSGFVAKDIRIDVDYGGDNIWISEWVKAYRNKGEKKGTAISKSFLLAPKILIQELKTGATNRDAAFVAGSLNLEKVCNTGHAGYSVLVRVIWENEGGHVFDEIHEYKLVCTEVDSGRSLTFIPKGIIYGKNMR